MGHTSTPCRHSHCLQRSTIPKKRFQWSYQSWNNKTYRLRKWNIQTHTYCRKEMAWKIKGLNPPWSHSLIIFFMSLHYFLPFPLSQDITNIYKLKWNLKKLSNNFYFIFKNSFWSLNFKIAFVPPTLWLNRIIPQPIEIHSTTEWLPLHNTNRSLV